MGRTVFLIALLVFLQFSSIEAYIKCYHNANNVSGALIVEENNACQIRFDMTKDSNGCHIIKGPARLTAVGPRIIEHKVLAETGQMTIDTCRFDEGFFTCNCNTEYCNLNMGVIWPLFKDFNVSLTEECRKAWIEKGYDEIIQMENTTNPETGKILTGPVKEPKIDCAVTESEDKEKGHYCVIELPLIDRTCYITGTPIRRAVNETKDDVICTSSKKVTITCNTDNCNDDIDIIREKIIDGIEVSGGNHIAQCKQQLLVSLEKAFLKPDYDASTATPEINLSTEDY